jgi:hypothetical protein
MIVSRSIITGVCLLIGGLLAGCAAHLPLTTDQPRHTRGTGLYRTAQGEVFSGVGSSAATGPTTLFRATADNRAQEEMTRVLSRYLAALSQSSSAMAARPAGEREQIAGGLLRSVLKHAVISDHWSDDRRGRFYALCEVRLDTVKAVIRQDADLDGPLRAELLSAADTAYRRLSMEFQTENQ